MDRIIKVFFVIIVTVFATQNVSGSPQLLSDIPPDQYENHLQHVDEPKDREKRAISIYRWTAKLWSKVSNWGLFFPRKPTLNGYTFGPHADVRILNIGNSNCDQRLPILVITAIINSGHNYYDFKLDRPVRVIIGCGAVVFEKPTIEVNKIVTILNAGNVEDILKKSKGRWQRIN